MTSISLASPFIYIFVHRWRGENCNFACIGTCAHTHARAPAPSDVAHMHTLTYAPTLHMHPNKYIFPHTLF